MGTFTPTMPTSMSCSNRLAAEPDRVNTAVPFPNAFLLTSAIAWLHLGANFGAAVGADPLLQTSSSDLQQLATDELTAAGVRMPRQRPVGDEPAGEAHAVFQGNGDYISILGSNGLFHHPHDRWPVAVDIDEIVRYARAFTAIGIKLANTT